MKYSAPEIYDIHKSTNMGQACCQDGGSPDPAVCHTGTMPHTGTHGCIHGSLPSYSYCCLGSNLFSGECTVGVEMGGGDCHTGTAFR